MFDKQTADLYKSIKASDSLKERVLKLSENESAKMQSQNKNFVFELNKKYKKFIPTAVAAMFCIVIGLFALQLSPESIDVLVAGQNLDSGAVQIQANDTPMLARAAEPAAMELDEGENISIELDIDLENEAQITVTEGILTLPEENFEDGGTLKIKSASKVLWNLEGMTDDDTAILIISGKKQQKIYTLSKTGGMWTLGA